MTDQLAKTYETESVQDEIAQLWADHNAFDAEPDHPGPPYAIVIPPPNVTAALHLGHALNNTLQDVLIRWRRMAGDNAIWLPGTDHAGIATQTVVEKRVLADQGKRRTDFERDAFVKLIQQWKDEYEATITGQLKAMGCSCDWRRQAFTMDEQRAKAVREAFFQLFKDGLIYRGKRLVNWDPATQTALADDEVEMQEIDGHFWYLKYPLVDARGKDTGEFVTVATTRPETMLGDTAVAVNPSDAPRAQHIGQNVRLPIVNRIIPVVGDDYVVKPDPESSDEKAKYASGYLKVTPAHDTNDYEIGQRHDLPVINVMAPDGSISKDHGWLDWETNDHDDLLENLLGMDRYKARDAIVSWFRASDLLAEVRPYTHTVGHSYRSHVPVEPYLSDQWYVKVTDDRLAGAALRALTPDQRTEDTECVWTEAHPFESVDSNEPRPSGSGHPINNPVQSPTSRDREGAVFNTYLITFTTYGTWLHGDDRGSVDREHNLTGESYLIGDEDREQKEYAQLKHNPYKLSSEQHRAVVQDAIQEVSQHRKWNLHAIHVRPTHLHAVVDANVEPEKVMNDFKAYATRGLRLAGLAAENTHVWTRHGSTRYLNDVKSIEASVCYVLERQGTELQPAPLSLLDQPLPHGRGSYPDTLHETRASASGSHTSRAREQAESESVTSRDREGAVLRFTPTRYARTFQTWHENIRDWCISRQLWWGHRIPVWHITFNSEAFDDGVASEKIINKANTALQDWAASEGFEQDFCLTLDRSFGGGFVCARSEDAGARLDYIIQHALEMNRPKNISKGEQLDPKLWKYPDIDKAFEFRNLISSGKRDPDVLDTWFSSALWPLSTLGWPEDSVELAKWNPTSVLSTAREIITLWVSRMVMFNCYFRGQLPFTDVFIHAMIQDGEGRKMSKSLGNGVDPLDIIHTHGADAMRFTLVQMTTQTQDVRMPVERDEATGRNTSPKFDIGRNFCTKMWNAARFALSNLDEGPIGSPAPEDLALADRWVLSRLAQTVATVDKALGEYQFNVYAQAMYDFFWRDLCDWYLEAIKPIVREDTPQGATARAVLAACLDAALRLLHPITPFVTEKLFGQLNTQVPARGVPGLQLPAGDLCIKAAWPQPDPSLHDETVEFLFERIQELIGMIRQVRNEENVPPRETVDVSAKLYEDIVDRAQPHVPLIEHLANVKFVAIGTDTPRPENSAVVVRPLAEVYLHKQFDPAAELERLTKRQAELNKSRGALAGRLNNKGYTDKAPAHLVEETRQQLAQVERELETVAEGLARLQ